MTDVDRDLLARRLCSLTGASCIAIGAGHYVLGTERTVAGARHAPPTWDSQDRFFATVFAWYGLAWWRAGRRERASVPEVRALSAVFAIGGLGRILSLVHRGRPHWFMLVLTAIELVVPAVFWRLLRGRSS